MMPISRDTLMGGGIDDSGGAQFENLSRSVQLFMGNYVGVSNRGRGKGRALSSNTYRYYRDKSA